MTNLELQKLSSLMHLIKQKYPAAIERWDGWQYKVTGPVSLDDVAKVFVTLENKDGMIIGMELELS